jgi:hypothetical protein
MRAARRTRFHRRRIIRPAARLRFEDLETRLVPAASNSTLDLALSLGALDSPSTIKTTGTITNGAGNSGDVNWYSFTLTSPADVQLSTLDQQNGSSLKSVLTLYNSDPFDFADAQDPLHHRQLAQDDGGTHGGDAQLDTLLGPGTYYVAVSGSGNLYFNPLIAGSGYPGSTGIFTLQVTTTNAGIATTDGPAVLTTNPAPGSVLSSSPFVIRLDTSSALDPTTITPDQTLTLTYNATDPTFSNGTNIDITVTANFSAAANELQLTPAAPLAPGYYKVWLAGDTVKNSGNVIASPTSSSNPIAQQLGQNALHPNGADYTTTFQIQGIEGVVGATTTDDTLATAQQLGDITQTSMVQVNGAIGNDPTDPNAFSTGGVNLYEFHISGTSKYAFTAEVFAGRIGSPLDPALSLFQLVNGQLQLVDANDNTRNPTTTTDGSGVPLYTDAALFDGLPAGDYFLAVSASPNLPDPTKPWQPGPNVINGVTIFDPTATHSASPNFTTPGPYVLCLAAQPSSQPPTVVGVTPSNSTTLPAPPTQLTVQFSEPVNLQQLTFTAYQQTNQNSLNAAYIQAADGTKYFPRLVSYDSTTNTASFLMLDRLPNGTYSLHLSGKLGLTDFAGNALVGNDPSGDYVTTFTVNGPPSGANGNSLQFTAQEPNDSIAQPQDLGILFPMELANPGPPSGVIVTGDFAQEPANDPSDQADYYEFQLLQNQSYVFSVDNPNLQLALFDSAGNPVPTSGQPTSLQASSLPAGTYIMGVIGPLPANATTTKYQLSLALAGSYDNPPPLTIGPAPAIQITFAKAAPPGSSAPSNPPANNPPPNNPPANNLPPNNQAPNNPPPANNAPPASSPSAPNAPASNSPSQGTPPQLTVATSPAITLHTTGAPASGPSPSVNLPSNLLVALSVGPTGGVQGAGPGPSIVSTVSVYPDKVLVQGSNPVLAEGLVRITVLTPAGQFSGNYLDDADANNSMSGVGNRQAGTKGLFKPLFQSWRRALDAVFSIKDWFHSTTAAPAPNTAALDAMFEELEVEDEVGSFELEAAVPTIQANDGFFARVSGSHWANTLAAMGAAMLFTGRKPRCTKPEPRLRLQCRDDYR